MSKADYHRKGYPSGENHPRAKLTDADVDLIRELYEAGGWSYALLAEKFEVSKSQIRNIVTCINR